MLVKMSVRIGFALLVLCIVLVELKAASIKKSIEKKSVGTIKSNKLVKPAKPAKTASIPAIIAIEIIDDPKSNSSKNSKRTIDGSLGYGSYHSFNPRPTRKFVIYKYSQQDIPPYPYNDHQTTGYSTNTNLGHHTPVSSSVEVTPSRLVYQGQIQEPDYYQSNNAYHPTVGYQGQGPVPYQNVGQAGAVPVILLRVYSNQLENPTAALHTSLPQNHPYASLNNVNLQSLLQNYMQQYVAPQPNVHQYVAPQPNVQQYVAPQANVQQYVAPQPTVQQYYTPQYNKSPYQEHQQYQTHENTYQPHQATYQAHQHAYQQQQISYQTPQPVYQYQQPAYQQQQVYEGHHQTYQQQQPAHDEHESHKENLPTYENYPSQKHTRVVFHSNNNGHLPEPVNHKVSVAAYRAPEPSYPDETEQEPAYDYSANAQDQEQNYMYVYPNQDDQSAYYQQNQQAEQYEQTENDYDNQEEPTQNEDEHTEAPHNYHAKSENAIPKQKRSRTSSVEVSPKKRQTREKTT